MAINTFAPPIPEIPQQRRPSPRELGAMAYAGAHRNEADEYVGHHRAAEPAIPHEPDASTLPPIDARAITMVLPLYSAKKVEQNYQQGLDRTRTILGHRADTFTERDRAAFYRATRPPLSVAERTRLIAAHTGDFRKVK